MREIKFRAWNGEGMFYGGFAIHATGDVLPDMIKPKNIMQFTGLKDKKGKSIYEGDIVKQDDKDTLRFVRWWENGWHLQKCILAVEEHAFHTIQYPEEFLEIIGNIHKNPELLK